MPRRISADARRQQLLEAALHVFSEKGYAEASTKDLAQAAHVAEGLFYHYFPSKEALLQAVIEHFSFVNQMEPLIKNEHHRAVEDVLLDIGLNVSHVLRANRRMVQIYLAESQHNPLVAEHLQRLISTGTALVSSLLAQRAAAENLPPHRVRNVARIFLFSVFLNQHMQPEIEDLQIFIEDLVAIALGGLGLS